MLNFQFMPFLWFTTVITKFDYLWSVELFSLLNNVADVCIFLFNMLLSLENKQPAIKWDHQIETPKLEQNKINSRWWLENSGRVISNRKVIFYFNCLGQNMKVFHVNISTTRMFSRTIQSPYHHQIPQTPALLSSLPFSLEQHHHHLQQGQHLQLELQIWRDLWDTP